MNADPDRDLLKDRIEAVLGIDATAPAVEFDGRWWTWGELAETSSQVQRSIAEHAPGDGAPVGVILRNRPSSVGVLLGVLRANGCVVTINPERGIERTREDIDGLELAAIAGEPDDLESFASSDVRRRVAVLSVPGLDSTVDVAVPDAPAIAERRAGVAVRMLTSGTTGPPKRIDLSAATLARTFLGAKHYESKTADPLALRRGVAIVNAPLVHLSGIFRVLQCVSDARNFVLLEKFRVDTWADAVRRHHPRTVSLVPAALRMVLDSDLAADDLEGVQSVISGTAPLSPDDAEAFTERFGVPVLISYAATEFGGGVAGWNLKDHQRYWGEKRGSVGRAHPGCDLRVVDPTDGRPLPAGDEGLLEVRASQLGTGTDFVRTTDLARIDEDGFVWILGRADQAIIRGGFKVRPEDVQAVLESHPGVGGASVIGVDDSRLGAVPIAVVERRPGYDDLDEDALLELAATRLSRYELPTEIVFVERLPRTASAKVDLGAVRSIVEERSNGTRP